MNMRHYRRFLLLLVLLLETTFGLVGYAQQVMLADSITKNPVCYATVYDANGTVIGRSDMGGYPRVSFIMMIASFSYLRHFIQYQKSVLQQRKRNTIIVKCTLGV